ncbi:MAG: hypothetical protein L0956_10510 [Candidatus Mariimomonas ferrooxydans]
MAKRGGMYSANKRRKELKRQKKQEEKRLRRQKDAKIPSQGSEINNEPASSGEAPEVTET